VCPKWLTLAWIVCRSDSVPMSTPSVLRRGAFLLPR
jgi:hypothetical protein